MTGKDLLRRIGRFFALADQDRSLRTGRELVEAVERARLWKGLPEPPQTPHCALQGERQKHFPAVGQIEPGDVAEHLSREVAVRPSGYRLA